MIFESFDFLRKDSTKITKLNEALASIPQQSFMPHYYYILVYVLVGFDPIFKPIVTYFSEP